MTNFPRPDNLFKFYNISTDTVDYPTLSGSCGENLSFLLDEAGKMTIFGTGNMSYFEQEKNSSITPWYDYKKYIKEVVVEEGVTSISNDAFAWCNNLTKVTLPDTLLRLDYQAFYCCENLSEITLPGNVKTIGAEVFAGDPIIHFSIPDSVTSIIPIILKL